MSNPPAGCDEIREWLGVYVLGALEPGEDAPIEIHLARCAACRSERDGLAGVVRLLHEALPLPAEAHDARPTPWADRRHRSTNTLSLLEDKMCSDQTGNRA